jgi:RNA polymerase sigma factor (sigma-70 family)
MLLLAPCRSDGVEDAATSLWKTPGSGAGSWVVSEDLNSKQRLRWERRCLERLRAGDRAALGELYRAFADPLYRNVLLPRLGQRDAAEDALSETFRTALEKLDGYQQRGSSVYFWLARIAMNKAMDLHRARAVTGRALVSVRVELALTADEAAPDQLLELMTEREAATQQMLRCLEELNPRYRRVLELRFLRELPRERCAEEMGVKLGTLDVLVLRALRALRQRWQRHAVRTEWSAPTRPALAGALTGDPRNDQ